VAAAYAATPVEKIFYGQAGCLGQNVHKAFELGITYLCEKEHFYISRRTPQHLLWSRKRSVNNFLIDLTADFIFSLLRG